MKDQNGGELLEVPQFQSILVRCLEQLERGEPLDREEFLQRHPQYADRREAGRPP